MATTQRAELCCRSAHTRVRVAPELKLLTYSLHSERIARRYKLTVGNNQMGLQMLENQSFRPCSVVGPLGEELTLDKLPPANTRRWVPRRKAEVVAAVDGGLLTNEEACERYGLSVEELASWQRAVDRSGMHGLRITRLQHYRDLYERRRY